MIQATVHLSPEGQIIGQFWANSKPIGKPQIFSNRDQAENYMSKAFKRELVKIQSCWIGTGYKQVLYLTRLEPNDSV